MRRRLEKALLGRNKGGRKLGDGPQRLIVRGGDRPVRMNKEHGVAETAAFAEHHRKPLPQRLGILDIAGLDRPLDAAGIGKRANRIGRRQPRHETIQRGASVRSFPRKRESRRLLPFLVPAFAGTSEGAGGSRRNVL